MTKYTQAQVKGRREVIRNVDGKDVTLIRFKAVLRYPEPNPEYQEKPEGVDTRTAKQKRRTVYKEISKSLEVEKVPTQRGRSQEKARELTEARIQEAVNAWREEAEREAAMTDDAKLGFTKYANNVLSLRNRASVHGLRRIEDSTMLDYSKTLLKLSPDFDSIAVGDITPKFVKDWYRRQLDAGASPNLVRKCHRLLSMILRYAYRQEDIDSNPMERVQAPQVPRKEPDSLTHDGMREVTQALEKAEPTPVVVAAYIALHAGLRGSEICALRWRDIDFEAGTLTVSKSIGFRKGGTYLKNRTKNGKSRTIAFDSPHMAKVLKKRCRLMFGRDDAPSQFVDFYVIGDVDGSYATPATIERAWIRLAEELELKSQAGARVNMHMLRHSYITAALEAGAALQDVASNAGHVSTQMTADTYAVALAKGKRQAATLAGDWMRPKAAPKDDKVDVLAFDKTGTEG